MLPPLQETENLVRHHFEDQVDSQGVPMAEHMRRVAAAVPDNEIIQTVAWLHDLVEDTPVTLNELTDLGYPAVVVEAVALLTHNKKEMDYQTYIQRLCDSKNSIALCVKIADQRDNLNPKRWLGMNQYMAQALSKKWAGVLPKLEEALCYASR